MRKRMYTSEQRERYQKRNAAWQKANPEKMRGYYRRHDLKRHYGLSPEQYEAMLEAQGGGCAICGAPPKAKRLPVDHDHQTNEVRGLLCPICNHALERMETFPDWHERALQYLARNKGAN